MRHHNKARSVERIQMELVLWRSLDSDQLSIVYQPQVDREGRIMAAEALLRWRSNDGRVRWMPFTGQLRSLKSLAPGGRNRVGSHCRPHGECFLPGNCEVLHGSTSTGNGPG